MQAISLSSLKALPVPRPARRNARGMAASGLPARRAARSFRAPRAAAEGDSAAEDPNTFALVSCLGRATRGSGGPVVGGGRRRWR